MSRIVYIILNYKTYQDTIKVTNEICQFHAENDLVLIVDNHSPNESSKELHRIYDNNEKVFVIDAPENGGYAKGNNFGLKYAKVFSPRFVCIMNNDVHFSSQTMDSLCRIYDMLDNPALISPIQLLPSGDNAKFVEFKVPNILYDLRMNTLFFRPKLQKYESNTKWPNVQRVGYLPGALLFTDYSIFESIGFFDECTFLFCEERFTGKAVQESGLNNYLVLDLTYLHEHSKTINNEATSKKQRRLIHEGRLKYYGRYSNFPFLTKMLLRMSFYFHEFELFLISIIR